MSLREASNSADVQRPPYAEAYDGKQKTWRVDALRRFTAEQWKQWIHDRLMRRDKTFPYGRDEWPEICSRIFLSVADFCRSKSIGLQPARHAVVDLIEKLTPESADSWYVDNLMRVARYLTEDEADDGADPVAAWIRSKKLLGRPDGHVLQRLALIALVELQKRKGGQFLDIWDAYLHGEEPPGKPDGFFYTVAAFQGKVRAAGKVPVADLVLLLSRVEEARQKVCFIADKAAVRSLWKAWPTLPDREAIVSGFTAAGGTERQWQLLRGLSEPEVPLGTLSYERKCAASPAFQTSDSVSAGTWGATRTAAARTVRRATPLPLGSLWDKVLCPAH